MFKRYSGICLEHIKNKHIITRLVIGKHGYQNLMDYEGSSKTFIWHYFMANMIWYYCPRQLVDLTVSKVSKGCCFFGVFFFRANVRQ